ncbi:hypothetical protein [Streptomyces sp. NPDC059008]
MPPRSVVASPRSPIADRHDGLDIVIANAGIIQVGRDGTRGGR